MMNCWIYCICLFFFSQTVYAQDSTIRYGRPAAVLLKVAPLSILVDPDATIQAGAEVRVSKRNSMQAEVGFGRKGFAITTDDKQNFTDWSVWRVRSEWRHYMNRYRTNKRKNIRIRSDFPLGNYLAIEGFAKQINGTKAGWPYNNESISSPVEQSVHRFVWGSHVKWGRQIALPGETSNSLSRVLLDFYVGVGIRYGSTETNPELGSCGCGFVPNRFAKGHSILPSAAAGIKIGLVTFRR
jgi:hypothetical protein